MAETKGDEASTQEKAPVTIKKYANRRLYNTATSSYVTLDHLAQMVKDGAEFVVYDAKTGEEITRAVLTHIIVEEESKGQNLLPISFLRHLISFYGDNLQALVPRYLEQTMQAFAHNQEQMRQYMRDTMSGLTPFGQLEEMGKQNLAIFDSAMRMFSPFGAAGGESKGAGEEKAKPEASDEQLDELRAKIDGMQKQLDSLTAKKRRS